MQKDYVSFERKLMRINAWDKVDKKKSTRERKRGGEEKISREQILGFRRAVLNIHRDRPRICFPLNFC